MITRQQQEDRRRRWRFERQFDQSLLARIELGRVRLRDRMRFAGATVCFAPFLALACALFLDQISDGSLTAAVIAGGTSLVVFTVWFASEARKWRARFRARLERLEKIRQQLIGVVPRDSAGPG